ncbi:15-hydroxyprostaglandin dehydrogenase [Hyphodiscus hymeniophilus]|uniref:15-hydroxyprostaglandin dehydrogenase n=1 Tax=Hyphodiscus hymeniophilus TaxID=353542 RepID=A0A9P6VJ28_9HELO|nr:15-hydroxyprostaglandin dehydrogenase [Hyphodiscus hymeniophilus]
MSFAVRGKTAIATGAGSGITLAFARLLLSRGCNVLFADLALRPEARQLVDEYSSRRSASRAVFCKCDVTQWDDLEGAFAAATTEFGGVDVVCPGAGIYEPHFMTERKQGSVVHISSIAGQRANLFTPLYIASKHGINGFVRSLALLEEAVGVRVTAVAPGIIKTPLWTEHPEKLKTVGEEDDWVSPESVAEVMLDLIEKDSCQAGSIEGVPSSASSPYNGIKFVTSYDDRLHPSKRRRVNIAIKQLTGRRSNIVTDAKLAVNVRQNAMADGRSVWLARTEEEDVKDIRKLEKWVSSHLSTIYEPLGPDQESCSGRSRSVLEDEQLFPDQSDRMPEPFCEAFLDFSPLDGKTTDTPDASTKYPKPRTSQHRVPYFRYFGPTAIAPGYKQMVVQVKEHAPSIDAVSATSPSSSNGSIRTTSDGNSLRVASERQLLLDVPVYDRDCALVIDPLILRLVGRFFDNLGCNFPFLQRRKFFDDIKKKQIEPMLVNAICAVSERFCSEPLMISSPETSTNRVAMNAEIGQVFAHRARAAVVESYPCPTISCVQTCLLLAYDEFGRNHDSGLWMQLGCSIRMAQDLGLQKVKEIRRDSDAPANNALSNQPEQESDQVERTLTFWAVLMTDRYVSSGTGRPVTLQDKDIQIPFPSLVRCVDGDQWPKPFPALIRIVHLYGKVTDLLNSIGDEFTADAFKNLAAVETRLTVFYQSLSSSLHFNATNFQQYVKAGEGTNFILLHFWFHALIVLVHQPTLLHGFTNIEKLFPNSREVSMSSAKTIVDIIAFAELIDPKSFTGTPFTSQPIYIAASSFLLEMERLKSSQPASRAATPPSLVDHRTSNPAKHTLLATAAIRNYQRCYKALQSQEAYWTGIKYILTALKQKAEGIWDPLLYTDEEMDSTRPPPSLAVAWKRKPRNPTDATNGITHLMPSENGDDQYANADDAFIDPTQAIGWSLAGTVNSPTFNLNLLYPNTSSGASLINGRDEVALTSGSLENVYDSFPYPPLDTMQRTTYHPVVEPNPHKEAIDVANFGHVQFNMPSTAYHERPPSGISPNRHTRFSERPYQESPHVHTTYATNLDATTPAQTNPGSELYPSDGVMISSHDIDMAWFGIGDLDFFPRDVLDIFDSITPR